MVFHVCLFRPLHEVYHLWRLAGGDMEGELKKRGLIKTKPPIMTLPVYVTNTLPNIEQLDYDFGIYIA